MAEKFGTKPSEVMLIPEPFDAYCLDQAVFVFGTAVRNAISEASESRGNSDTDKRRQQRAQQAFDKMLGLAPKFASADALIEKAKSNG